MGAITQLQFQYQKMSSAMKNNRSIFIGEWSRNNEEVTRVRLEKFKGQKFLQIRRWIKGKDGKLFPTQKGETVPIEHLRRLQRYIKKARNMIDRLE
jgi:Transcriptional Coactivator p15 (PC4)